MKQRIEQAAGSAIAALILLGMAVPGLAQVEGVAPAATDKFRKQVDELQSRVSRLRNKGDRFGEALNLKSLGNAYSCLNDFNRAIPAYQRASTLVTGEQKSLALSELGYALFKTGKVIEAEKTLRNAIAVFEADTLQPSESAFEDDHNRKKLETLRAFYQSLQRTLVAQNKTNAALEAAEQSRAIALATLLSKRISQASSPKTTRPITLKQLQQIAKVQRATVVEYSIISDRFPIECWSTAEANQALRQKTELFIWVIQPTGAITFHRTDLAPFLRQENSTLPALVLSMRNGIAKGMRGKQNRLSQFYQLLIQPIAQSLPKNEQTPVIFIPDEMLFYVPFPALIDPKGDYLIQKHTLLTAPSIQILDLTRQSKRKPKGQGALVVGNPAPMPLDMSPLPGTEREANAIAALLKTRPLIGRAATKQTILQQMLQVKTIHLATHALYNENFGENSAIAVVVPERAKSYSLTELLTKPSAHLEFTFPNRFWMIPDNGLITAKELLDLSEVGIKAELAVLSACDTGRGELTGDGVVGLSRSLLAAGIPSVIVSLWAIPDAPTGALMIDFYRQLQRSPNKAVALRNAMLSTLKQNPLPRDWAAFTLLGESE
jgi:CHAT domain-containing protein